MKYKIKMLWIIFSFDIPSIIVKISRTVTTSDVCSLTGVEVMKLLRLYKILNMTFHSILSSAPYLYTSVNIVSLRNINWTYFLTSLLTPKTTSYATIYCRPDKTFNNEGKIVVALTFRFGTFWNPQTDMLKKNTAPRSKLTRDLLFESSNNEQRHLMPW